ncbi:GNAT family N-acetyltransferase [Thermodesulfobacteriota bacterium]
MKTWWDVYGQERELFVLCGYKGDQLIGIAPLSIGKSTTSYFKFLNYKTIWFLGSGTTSARGVLSEYLDFIIKRGYEDEFVEGFFHYMNSHNAWDEVLLENISSDSPLPSLLKKCTAKSSFVFKVVNKGTSILINLPKSWEEYLKSISSSLRYKIRRGRKEFSKIGGSYHLVTNESDLPKAFADLEKLHQRRWSNKGIAGAFSSPEWKSFHEKLIPMLFEKGQLKLSFLIIGKDPVAANYNFAFDNKIHYFQSGMIPHQNKHVRLGLLLHSYCIEEAIQQGYREYDFLIRSESGIDYKDMWGNCSRDLLKIRLSKNSAKESLFATLTNMKDFAGKAKSVIAKATRKIKASRN